ncbi:MAG: hypothetical protein AB7E55_30965, partial [Pigmentiphaga sp.]
LWLWFGLSRASFLVLPRILMHDMSDEWQAKMAALLDELDRTFPAHPAGTTLVRRREGKFPSWLLNYRRPDEQELARLRHAPEQETDNA